MEVPMPNESTPAHISVKEAALMADRTVKTIRSWISKGILETHREDPQNSLSKIWINRQSLQIHLGTNVQANPPRKSEGGNQPKVQGEVVTKTTLLETKITHLEELLEREKRDTTRLEGTLHEVRTSLQEMKMTLDYKDREIEKLKEELERKADYEKEYKRRTSMSWWLRLLDKPVDIPQKQLPGPTPE
jgi:hypothetical protein